MPAQKNYPCADPKCGRTFKSARAMKIHFTRAHNPKPKKR